MYKYELKLVPLKEAEVDYSVLCPEDIVNFAFERLEMQYFPEERGYLVCIDSKAKIIGYSEVSKGSLTGSLVHPREVYKTAILMNAFAIFFLHNHPSGNPAHSSDDVLIAHKLAEAGEVLGIPMRDFIIIGNDNYESFREQGIIR